jgi:hypothetical protein
MAELPNQLDIDEFEECEYDLTHIGLYGLSLVIEENATYIEGDDVYIPYEWLPKLKNEYPITLTDETSRETVSITWDMAKELREIIKSSKT